MYEYSHGGNAAFEPGKENTTDLSVNINPLGMPENVKEAVAREIANCSRYPDSLSRDLREKISVFEKTRPEYIFCGNGASDIIFRLPGAINAQKAIVTAPTFSDYERACASFGTKTIGHKLAATKSFDLDESIIETTRREKPDLVFICNPNNPTGRLTETGLIRKLLDLCRQTGACVAVDECFLDFTEQAAEYTSKRFIEHYPNLVIIKAFTKLFSLPGIRLGYAISSGSALIDSLYSHGADWPVSNLAQAAGSAALDGADSYIKKTVSYVSGERLIIEEKLKQLGYKVNGAAANYVFFQNPFPANLSKELDKKAIRIRSCGNYNGLDGSYCRAAVSTKENNGKFLAAISDVTERTMKR